MRELELDSRINVVVKGVPASSGLADALAAGKTFLLNQAEGDAGVRKSFDLALGVDGGLLVTDEGTDKPFVISAQALFERASQLAKRLGLHATLRAEPPALCDTFSFVTALAFECAGTERDFERPEVILRTENDRLDETVRETVRVVLCSGSRRRMRAIALLYPRAKLFNAWGDARTAGPCLVSRPNDPRHAVFGTRGRPLPGLEAMIIDPKTGRDLGLYEPGELWLRGRYLRASPNAGGYLRTGLRAWLDYEGRIALAEGVG